MVLAREVEAKNFVLNIGHLRDEGSQWCNQQPPRKGGSAFMRRIVRVLAVMALLVLTVAVPAFARNSGTELGGPPALSGGQGAVVVHCNSEEVGGEGAIVENRTNVGFPSGGGNCQLA